MTELILEVRHLVSSFQTEIGEVRAVDGVNFSLRKGRTLGLVGESGSGKGRLLLEAATHAEILGHVVLRGQCSSRADRQPFQMLDGIVARIISELQEKPEAVEVLKEEVGELADALTAALPSMFIWVFRRPLSQAIRL